MTSMADQQSIGTAPEDLPCTADRVATLLRPLHSWWYQGSSSTSSRASSVSEHSDPVPGERHSGHERPVDQFDWSAEDLASLRRDRYEAEQVRLLYGTSNGIDMSDVGISDPFLVSGNRGDHGLCMDDRESEDDDTPQAKHVWGMYANDEYWNALEGSPSATTSVSGISGAASQESSPLRDYLVWRDGTHFTTRGTDVSSQASDELDAFGRIADFDTDGFSTYSARQDIAQVAEVIVHSFVELAAPLPTEHDESRLHQYLIDQIDIVENSYYYDVKRVAIAMSDLIFSEGQATIPEESEDELLWSRLQKKMKQFSLQEPALNAECTEAIKHWLADPSTATSFIRHAENAHLEAEEGVRLFDILSWHRSIPPDLMQTLKSLRNFHLRGIQLRYQSSECLSRLNGEEAENFDER